VPKKASNSLRNACPIAAPKSTPQRASTKLPIGFWNFFVFSKSPELMKAAKQVEFSVLGLASQN
jgi:hypothetical protein